uniref:Uncharacterized protein n=1 Tax=Heterorhabditis bacteriophora TaxID=37862 RepID=A0A1I7WJA5_HETBA
MQYFFSCRRQMPDSDLRAVVVADGPKLSRWRSAVLFRLLSSIGITLSCDQQPNCIRPNKKNQQNGVRCTNLCLMSNDDPKFNPN